MLANQEFKVSTVSSSSSSLSFFSFYFYYYYDYYPYCHYSHVHKLRSVLSAACDNGFIGNLDGAPHEILNRILIICLSVKSYVSEYIFRPCEEVGERRAGSWGRSFGWLGKLDEGRKKLPVIIQLR